MRLLALLGIVTGLGWGQEHVPENAKNPLAEQPAAIAAGKRLYEQTCQACHGGNAAGSERGPALSTGVFKHGAKDGEIFLNIRNGVKGTQMPPFGGLKTDQVWAMVSYLRSLGGGPVKTNEVVAGNAAAGEKLFFGAGGCAGCHAVNARGGVVGPDLSAAGAMSAEMLRQKLVDPASVRRGRGRRPTGPTVTTAKLADGRTIRGVARNQDTFTLHLMDSTGRLHLLDKRRVTVTTEAGSLMPATKLAAAEIDDVVAYLKGRSGRDLSETVKAEIAGGLSYERIRNAAAEPQNWLTYWGNYDGTHYSALGQVTTANVKTLQTKWAAQMPGDTLLQSTPLVVDGVMYTSGMPGQVFALDARTGMEIWRYERKQRVVNAFESNRFNRGVAVLGNRVFVGTLDAALVALDARTGLPLWETQVADTMEGYSVTAAPLAVKDKIIVGVAGGEHGIRGFLDAYDPKTGKRLWRFHTTPGEGEFGNETWKGDSWKRGGSGTWLTGSYDPELNLLYWATGNPGPDMDGEIRKGDNLFSCSVLALDPDTGKRKWHYQFTPNDTHDWDANQDLLLVNRGGRKLLVQTNRNGIFYVLDRTNGKFVMGKPYVRQTWNDGFEADGRPKVRPNSDSTPEGREVAPSLVGGTNWQSPSYDAKSGWMYVVYADAPQRYLREPSTYEPGKAYWGGRSMPTGEPVLTGIKAIDTATGTVQWDYKISKGSLAAGVLATAGGVLMAATSEGNLIALDAKTAKPLWTMQTGGTIASSPMSYAVDGKQYIAVSAGGVLYSWGLPE
jgi:PQQ-dependent dehydrogenase (methanol/ethanol family)